MTTVVTANWSMRNLNTDTSINTNSITTILIIILITTSMTIIISPAIMWEGTVSIIKIMIIMPCCQKLYCGP